MFHCPSSPIGLNKVDKKQNKTGGAPLLISPGNGGKPWETLGCMELILAHYVRLKCTGTFILPAICNYKQPILIHFCHRINFKESAVK